MRKNSAKLWAFTELLEFRRMLSASVDGWTALSKVPKAKGLTSDLSLDAYKPFTLNKNSIANNLSLAPDENVKYGIGLGAASRLISIPTPDGRFARFRIVESSIMDPKLAAKFPDIKTYAGVGVDDPAATVRLDYTPLGFHAQVLTPTGKGAYYVEPYFHNDQGVYASYYGSQSNGRGTAASGYEDVIDGGHGVAGRAAATAGRTSAGTSGTAVSLRTYRAAVAATGEYTAYFGGTVALGQAAIVTAMNRVTGIYETELGIRLSLVANNSTLVYTNAATDPYTNDDPSSLLSENQANIDSIIGNTKYDIGHVFSTAGGGLAQLGVVGAAGYKAQGETGTSAPVGDAFYVDYVAHEMGHQFGANHTFNTSADSNRNFFTAYEPGSGSTIMAYAGIEGSENLQPHSDPFFAFASLDEILNYVDTGTYSFEYPAGTKTTETDPTIPSVGTRTATGNNVPTVTFGTTAYTIPANTPFTLTSPAATDANGDTIYYSWEEADSGTAKLLTAADNGSGALFRVYNPTTSPSRTFPQLASILNGTNQTPASAAGGGSGASERLPTTSRAMKFVLTLRDKKAGAGGTNVYSTTPTTVTSVAAASTFAVTSPNTATALTGGAAQTVTWNVAGTTGNGINTANVSILLSTDNGASFPYTLAASTANDGTESVTLPTGLTSSTVRIKVAAVGNIYFDIDNAALSITPGAAAVSATPGAVDLAAATDSGTSNTDNLTNFNNATPAKAPLVVVSGCVPGATVTVYADGSTTPLASGTAASNLLTLTLNGSSALAEGSHTFTAKQLEPGKTLSAAGAALPVTIDTIAPAIVSKTLQFQTVKPVVTFAFDSSLAAGATSPTVVRNSPSPGSVSYNQFLSGTGNVANFGFDSSPSGILPNGDYTATLPADTYRDAAGNSTAATSLNFFVLAGDTDRNRIVNFNDFLTLQANFGSSQLDFTKGDFDYNGVIDFNDFLILQSNFGTKV